MGFFSESPSDKAKRVAKETTAAAVSKARKAASAKHVAGNKALADGERKVFKGKHSKAFIGGW